MIFKINADIPQKKTRKLVYVIVVVGAYYAYERFLIPDLPARNPQTVSVQSTERSARSSPPSEEWYSGQQVRGSGTVTRILSDDSEAGRSGTLAVRS